MSTDLLYIVLSVLTVAVAALMARRWWLCRVLGHRVGIAQAIRRGGSVERTSACVRCGMRFRGDRPLE